MVNLVVTDIVIDSTTTDSFGGYVFEDLALLTPYVIEVVERSGLLFSPQDQGADDAFDSDADPTTGRIPGQPIHGLDLTRDVGLLDAGLPPVAAIPTLSVSGRVLLALLTWLSMLWALRQSRRSHQEHEAPEPSVPSA